MRPEEDLLKKRQSVMDVGQRNQLEAVQTEVRRNNEALTTLRRENKELRSALQQSLRGQRNVSIEDHYAKEEELLHNKMCVLRRSLNAVKGKNAELSKEIERTREENQFIQAEGIASAVDESSAVARKIRALENRLDKCLIKHNEVNAIRRTYETLLERLQLEQAGFDTQLSSTEKALQSAEKELLELTEVGSQASASRDEARAEVIRLKAKLAEDRRTQGKDLEQRRGFIQDKRTVLEKKHNTLLVKMAQQDERHAKAFQNLMEGGGSKRKAQDASGGTGGGHHHHHGAAGGAAGWLSSLSAEEVLELQRQKEAYLKLRDATMSGNVADVIRKLVERRENHEQLEQSAADLARGVAEGRQLQARLQAAWDEMSQRAGGAMVSARATRQARDRHAARGDGTGGAGGDGDGDADDGTGAAAAPASGSGAGGRGELDYGLLANRIRQNRGILAEFAGHLKDREGQLEEAQKQQDTLSQLVTDVEAGVQHLAEKLSVQHTDPAAAAASSGDRGSLSHLTAAGSAATTTGGTVVNYAALLHDRPVGEAAMISVTDSVDLLRSCGAKMRVMMEEVTPAEVDAVARAMSSARVVVPATNLRIVGLVGPRGQQAAGSAGEAPAPTTTAAANEERAAAAGAGGRAVPADGGRMGDTSGSDVGALVATTGAQVDDFPDSEIHDRAELKMMALATVEREETKRMRKRMAAHRREETS